jgi:hypothetical protein
VSLISRWIAEFATYVVCYFAITFWCLCPLMWNEISWSVSQQIYVCVHKLRWFCDHLSGLNVLLIPRLIAHWTLWFVVGVRILAEDWCGFNSWEARSPGPGLSLVVHCQGFLLTCSSQLLLEYLSLSNRNQAWQPVGSGCIHLHTRTMLDKMHIVTTCGSKPQMRLSSNLHSLYWKAWHTLIQLYL